MRKDIQFLRGIAVLAVVIYHAGILSLEGGFLGVDVFFVISGFLITLGLLKGMENGGFSFKEFYIRRAKRLLPAAYSTFFFTTLLGYFFLTEIQWNDYIAQLLGSLTFTANMVLPYQVGYFEEAAEAKPLLHIWSLSLEEQYYLLLPLIIFLTPKIWRGATLFLLFIISIFTCFYFVTFPADSWLFGQSSGVDMVFYFLPTRAWELLAGSCVAWWMLKAPEFTIARYIKFIAFTALITVMLFPIDNVHPRGDSLVVVFATGLLLLGRDNWLPVNYLTRIVRHVGDWSYSLYLVHWPLLVFAYGGYLGFIPEKIRWIIFGLSFFIAYLQYRYIEQRFRYDWYAPGGISVRSLSGATLLIALMLMPAFLTSQADEKTDNLNFEYIRRTNWGINEFCAKAGFFENPSSCKTVSNPVVAVWGDSFAMHLMPGLQVNPQLSDSLVQLTMSSCAPIINISRMSPAYDHEWAIKCHDFNNNSLKYILKTDSIKYVIISSRFHFYFNQGNNKFLFKNNVMEQDPKIAINQLIRTIEMLREGGKYPVIIAPPPASGFNIGECLERKQSNLVVFRLPGCSIPVADYMDYQKGEIKALAEVQSRTNVDVISIDNMLCGSIECVTKIGDIFIYRDSGHLSVSGSKYIIGKLELPFTVKVK